MFLRFRERVIPPRAALFWALVWILASIGIIHPATTTKLASFFGVGRGVDVIVYLAISVLFYLVFRIYVMIEDIRREITSLIRKIALEETETPPKRRKKRKK